MDRNDYYGGASTSLNLIQVYYNQIHGLSFHLIKVLFPWSNFLFLYYICFSTLLQLWKRFRGNDKPPEQLGMSKEYNVDMIPKVHYEIK